MYLMPKLFHFNAIHSLNTLQQHFINKKHILLDDITERHTRMKTDVIGKDKGVSSERDSIDMMHSYMSDKSETKSDIEDDVE